MKFIICYFIKHICFITIYNLLTLRPNIKNCDVGRYPKAVFPKGRFPEKFGLHYVNSAQSFRENVHAGKLLSGKLDPCDINISSYYSVRVQRRTEL